MERDIKEVLIVGGGDVGLLTALSLREIDTNLRIKVVDDLSSPPPRVGKSTFSAIMDLLHDFLGIDETTFAHTVKPIWKGTVWFRGWGESPDFHYPFAHGFPSFEEAHRHETLHAIYSNPYLTATPGQAIAEQGKTPWDYNPRGGGFQRYPQVAYHLPINAFWEFIKDRCESKNISLVDDKVEAAISSGSQVDAIAGRSSTYEADLYIDATGFNPVIQGQIPESSFVEFDLPLDRALRTSYERPLAEVIPSTVVEGHDEGWFWTIDTFNMRDRGFVYSSQFTSDDTAREIFLDQVDNSLDPNQVECYPFESGYLAEPWIENHLTIGNAAGFVEPLQSTALTTNLQFAKFLAYLLNSTGFSHDDRIRDTYNQFFESVWNNIYSFVFIHYAFNRTDAPLWKYMRTLELPPLAAEYYHDYDVYGLPYYEKPQTGFKMEPDGRTFSGSPFSKEDFFHLLVSMGVRSSYHESLDAEPNETAERGRQELKDRINAEVSEYHDYLEFYNVLLDQGTPS